MRYEELTIEGRNAVLEAFRSGKTIDKLFVLDGCQDGPVRTIIREARKYDTIISYVTRERLDQLFRQQPPAVIVGRSEELEPFPEMLELAKKHGVALLRSNETTCTLMGSLISVLNLELAPRITRHGVLVEVYGEGILILGDSGIGKSELAIELVKRGHRLVADDAVEIRCIADRLIGTAPEVIRNYIELRGIGVIDVRQLFGMRAVMPESQIDLVVEFEPWDSSKAYDRLGIEDRFIDILGKQVPCVTLPIRPGRNLASIVEVAAMNNRHRRYGYNAAEELARKVDLHADLGSKSANQGK